MRPAGWLALALVSAPPADLPPSPPVHPQTPTLSYVLESTPDLATLSITCRAWGAEPTTRWQPSMAAARGFVRNFEARASGGVTVVRYKVALRAMALRYASPDRAQVVADGVVFHDGTVLLRPPDLPQHARVTVSVPGAMPVATVWEPRSGTSRGWVLSGAELEGGSYVFMGPSEEVALQVAHARAHVAGRVLPAQRDRYQRWLNRSLHMLTDYNGGTLPVPRVHVLVVPRPGTDGGMFGTTLRWGHGSIVLYAGADASEAALKTDWVAPHELFHLANPVVDGRASWFTEGVTTYYQEVLRARGGARSPAAAWASLVNGATDTCGSRQDAPLVEASASMVRTRAYRRVYWGGACAALVLDVALRVQSGNRQSLDGWLKKVRAQSLVTPVPAEALAQQMEEAAPPGWGRRWVQAALHSQKPLPVNALWLRLGVAAPGGKGTAPDNAGWETVAHAIMGQPATGPVAPGAPLPVPP